MAKGNLMIWMRYEGRGKEREREECKILEKWNWNPKYRFFKIYSQNKRVKGSSKAPRQRFSLFSWKKISPNVSFIWRWPSKIPFLRSSGPHLKYAILWKVHSKESLYLRTIPYTIFFENLFFKYRLFWR